MRMLRQRGLASEIFSPSGVELARMHGRALPQIVKLILDTGMHDGSNTHKNSGPVKRDTRLPKMRLVAVYKALIEQYTAA